MQQLFDIYRDEILPPQQPLKPEIDSGTGEMIYLVMITHPQRLDSCFLCTSQGNRGELAKWKNKLIFPVSWFCGHGEKIEQNNIPMKIVPFWECDAMRSEGNWRLDAAD
jgi:hypothetical protein